MAAARGAVHALGQVLLTHWQLYLPTPRHVWWDLHQVYRYCEGRRLHRHSGVVSGAVLPAAQSVEDIYKRILVLWLADPFHWSQTELPQLYRCLSAWIGHVGIGAPGAFDGSTAPPFAVDLDSDLPPAAVESLGAPGPGCRLIDTAGLDRALRPLLLQRAPLLEAAADGMRGLPLCLWNRLLAALTPRSQRPQRRRAPQRTDAEALLGLRRIHELLTHNAGASAADHLPAPERPTVHLLELTELDYSRRSPPSWTRAADAGRPVSIPVRLSEQGDGGCRLVWSARQPAKVAVGELVCVHCEAAGTEQRVGVVRWIRQSGIAPVCGVQWLGCAATAVQLQAMPSKSDPQPELQPALMTRWACQVYKGDVLMAPRIGFRPGTVATLVRGQERVDVSLRRAVEQNDCYVVFEYVRNAGSSDGEPASRSVRDGPQEDVDDEFDALWGTI